MGWDDTGWKKEKEVRNVKSFASAKPNALPAGESNKIRTQKTTITIYVLLLCSELL